MMNQLRMQKLLVCAAAKLQTTLCDLHRPMPLQATRRIASHTAATTEKAAAGGLSEGQGWGVQYPGRSRLTLSAQRDFQQIGHRVGVELFHDVGAVRFDRFDADAQVVGDLLVQPTGNDALEHLALTGGQA